MKAYNETADEYMYLNLIKITSSQKLNSQISNFTSIVKHGMSNSLKWLYMQMMRVICKQM